MLKPRLTKYIKQEPTPKQTAFLLLNCRDAFYGGAAGGGKSSTLLMAALQYVDVPGYNALLVRKTYSDLAKPEALIDRSHEWLTGTDAHWNGEKKIWKFPSGATLSFGHLDGPMDHFGVQSSAYQFIGIDEMVQIRKNQALYLFRSLRRLKKYSFVPVRFRGASNPPAAEQIAVGAWVKRRYIDPKTRKKDTVFVSAKMDDNPYLDVEEYRLALDNLDPVTRAQQKDGDWDIAVKGRTFQREWFTIIPTAPERYKKIIRYWDIAATEPSKSYKDPDWSVGVKLGTFSDNTLFVEDVHRFQKYSKDVEKLIRQTAERDERKVEIKMEQEPGASGKMVIDHYTRNVLQGFTFKGYRSTGSKYERIKPFASQAQAGNVVLVNGRWIDQFFEEADLYPDGDHDDIVDACGSAYEVLCGPVVKPRLRVV
jgi:predicted phage terminase large subunit-like protein